MKDSRALAFTDSHDPPDLAAARPTGLAALLTLAEVAALLRINERTIRRMVATRRLPCVRIGRQIRFTPEALSRWLRAREEG
jgi:excisionase family DNA binding protein